jgi:3-methyladenine DNA glycosylase/8-oxoguanine DNA glycosylase
VIPCSPTSSPALARSRHRPRDPDEPFAALVRAIVARQLAGRAAQAIYGRMRAAFGDTLTLEALIAATIVA